MGEHKFGMFAVTPARCPVSIQFYAMIIASVTMMSTVAHLIVVFGSVWEHISYDLDGLLSNKKGMDLRATVKMDILNINGKSYCAEKAAHDSNVLFVWSDFDLKTNKCKTVEGALLIPETGGVWTRCFDTKDWGGVRERCRSGEATCNSYLHSNSSHSCCKNCPSVGSAGDVEISVHSLMTTAMASVVVSLVLQFAAWILIVLTLMCHSVTLCMITGVLFFLAGTFLCFVLIIEHYKLAVVMTTDNSNNMNGIPLVTMPPELMQYRRVTIGWGIILGWVSCLFTWLLCILWIWLSRFLGEHVWKVDDNVPDPHGTMTSAMSNDLHERPGRIKDRIRRISRVQPANGNIPGQVHYTNGQVKVGD